MKIVTRIFLTALTLLIVAKYVPGIFVESLTTALLAALGLAILNVFVKPILIFLTLPITLLTLGLFLLIINTGLFLLTAALIDGFSVASFGAAFIGSLVVSVVSAVSSRYL